MVTGNPQGPLSNGGLSSGCSRFRSAVSWNRSIDFRKRPANVETRKEESASSSKGNPFEFQELIMQIITINIPRYDFLICLPLVSLFATDGAH